MKVELFYLVGCPNRQLARERLGRALRELGWPDAVAEVSVLDPEAAVALRFLGSPSIRIDGVDIQPSARTSEGFGLTCRTYLEGGRREGAPSRELIGRALREARGE
jgi:hypothetical protein